MKLIDRHVSSEIFSKCCMAGFWLLCLYSFVALLELLDQYAVESDVITIVYLLALSLPRQIYELMPMVLIIGTLLGLATLSRHSELVALQAGSFSRFRISATAIGLAAVIAAVVSLFGEILVPFSERARDQIRIENDARSGKSVQRSDTWIRDGKYFLRYSDIDQFGELNGVTIYEVSDDGALKTRVDARLGRIIDKEQTLYLLNAVRYDFDDGHLKSEKVSGMVFPVSVTSLMLKSLHWPPEQLSFRQLNEIAAFLNSNGQNADTFEVASWNRLVIPLSSVLMVTCVVPFGFKGGRRSGTSFYTFLGVVVGLLYFVIQQSISYIVILEGLSAQSGAAITFLIFLAGAGIALLTLNKVRG